MEKKNKEHTTYTKMGAESLVKNTPNDPESAQFVYPSPTVLDLNEKGFIERL